MNIKRIIFLLIIGAVCVSAMPAQTIEPPNSLDMESLVGKVKRIDEETAEMRLQNGVLKEGSRARSRTIIFDKKGRMTYRWWKIGESRTSEGSFSYEKDNRRIERPVSNDSFANLKQFQLEFLGLSIFRYVPAEHALYRDVYQGEQLKINEPPKFTEQTQKYKYIFGDNNRLLETVDYSYDTGQESTHDKNIFGEDARLPIQAVITSKGSSSKETIKYTYTLDAQGNWTKRISEDTLADKNGTVVYRTEYRKITYYK